MLKGIIGLISLSMLLPCWSFAAYINRSPLKIIFQINGVPEELIMTKINSQFETDPTSPDLDSCHEGEFSTRHNRYVDSSGVTMTFQNHTYYMQHIGKFTIENPYSVSIYYDNDLNYETKAQCESAPTDIDSNPISMRVSFTKDHVTTAVSEYSVSWNYVTNEAILYKVQYVSVDPSNPVAIGTVVGWQ